MDQGCGHTAISNGVRASWQPARGAASVELQDGSHSDFDMTSLQKALPELCKRSEGFKLLLSDTVQNSGLRHACT